MFWKGKYMRIFQLVSKLLTGDGIGNDVIAIDKIFKKKGYNTKIYAIVIDENVPCEIADSIENLPKLHKKDVILYHFAVACGLDDIIDSLPCIRILVYHNITPPYFFEGYSNSWYQVCKDGISHINKFKNKFDLCIADSEYNKQNLIEMGYRCSIKVVPIIIPFEKYMVKMDKTQDEFLLKHEDILLFTGRICPNKKQEDVIKVFYYYKKYYNNKAKLFFVGSYDGMESYYNKLLEYIDTLKVEDVYFSGRVSFDDLLLYYQMADVFLCMSEHEGFCIPLIEAMHFELPIVAYDCTAIPYTLGNSGIMVKDKQFLVIAGIINKIINDKKLNEQIILDQNERLSCYAEEIVESKLLQAIYSVMPK